MFSDNCKIYADAKEVPDGYKKTEKLIDSYKL